MERNGVQRTRQERNREEGRVLSGQGHLLGTPLSSAELFEAALLPKSSSEELLLPQP